ncbi:MAG: His/Gly/Thr/Pro-type tRNA ligase C-terminal domain-containing protein, partial [Candidatus Omnitrophica bacterium]|nr:His/Gly/Thr/Pro-type tRNA ligase C-terminal domain-containing protein [Candidatus Omnitrophota bacterium]
YSAALGAQFQDEQGTLKPVIMGCYGIGVSRLISTVIEQNHDDNGIIWPREVAPFTVLVMPLDVTNSVIMEKATGLYGRLTKAGIRVLLDDRDERAGVKFKDADLIGVPLQVVIGKEALKSGSLELKERKTGQKAVDAEETVVARITEGA